jgi:hypothetical protein
LGSAVANILISSGWTGIRMSTWNMDLDFHS